MMSIKFKRSHSVPGRLATAEIHFLDGDLAGLRLKGFSVWQGDDKTVSVRFPLVLSGNGTTDVLVREIREGYWEFATASGIA